MEILLNLLLIIPIMFSFYKLKDTNNPFIYVGLITLCSIGLLISVFSPPFITTGELQEYTQLTNHGNASHYIQSIEISPLKIDLGVWGYILTLFYLLCLIGTGLYWSLSRDRVLDY